VSISKQDLVSLPFAARTVYQRAYGTAPPDAHLAERLNGLAYCLAQTGAVYAMDERLSAPRRLSREELASAHFRHGGKELHFLDDRAPILEIGVTRECMDKAVTALINQAASG
jgi:hypothetical protein